MGATNKPFSLKWRSNTGFIIAVVAIGLFTDLFLYGLVVPVLPFMLQDRVSIPDNQVQSYVSGLLAAYAGASVLFSVPAGWMADRTNARRTPFLAGLTALLAATVMLAFGQSIAVLVVARVLQGISAAVVWTIGLALVLDTVGPNDLGKVIGSIFSFISIGELAAPVLGGVLYDRSGYVGVFAVGAGLLAVDIMMRLLVIEKKVAARYEDDGASANSRDRNSRADDTENEEDVGEETTLLAKKEGQSFKIPDQQNRLVRSLPILYCLSDPRIATALFMSFVQASILAMFDATIPTEAKSLLGFSSLSSGLLFIALDLPYLLLGPVAGWAVDRYGTKPAAMIGFGFLVPSLTLLRLPMSGIADSDKGKLIIWCVVLALNGIGLASIGSPSIVEASDVIQKYNKANEGFFGKNGPYAQLYGFQSLAFSAGLTVGPILAGTLKDSSIGYPGCMAVFAAIAGVTAILAFCFVGGTPGSVKRTMNK